MYKKYKILFIIFFLVVVFIYKFELDYLTEYVFAIELPTDEFEEIDGDVNSDRLVNAKDALLVLKYSAKLIKLPKWALDLADMDNNTQVNAEDALRILKVAAKL